MDPMAEGASWRDEELAGFDLADARLGQRLRRLLEQLGGAIRTSLPLACQDWAATKAAYRFFDNDRVSEAQILAGHFAATASRVAATEGPILILHDAAPEFVYHRVRPEPVGVIGQYPCRNVTYDRRQFYTVCGLLACTQALASRRTVCRWDCVRSSSGPAPTSRARAPSNGISIRRACRSSKRRACAGSRTCVRHRRLWSIRARCIHIGDRESDIYELFVAAHELGTHFLVRSCVRPADGRRAPRRSWPRWRRCRAGADPD